MLGIQRIAVLSRSELTFAAATIAAAPAAPARRSRNLSAAEFGRAHLAADILRERLGGTFQEIRIDLIGSTSLHGRAFDSAEQPYEIRLRLAARAGNAEAARTVGEEVEALYTNGPAGGGGVRTSVHEQIGIVSTLIDRARIAPGLTVREWAGHAEAV